MQVASVEQYRSLAREGPAGHDVHQRGLARTVGTDDGNELGRANTQVGGVQDTLWGRTGPPARHVVADVAHQQLDIADAPAPGKRGPVEGQFEWADIDAVTWDQGTDATQPRTVDIGTIGAAEIAQHDGSVHYLERRVTARDIRMVEHDLPWHRLATNGQVVVERHAVRCDGTPIFVCLHDLRAIDAAREAGGLLALRSLVASHHVGCFLTQPTGRPSRVGFDRMPLAAVVAGYQPIACPRQVRKLPSG